LDLASQLQKPMLCGERIYCGKPGSCVQYVAGDFKQFSMIDVEELTDRRITFSNPRP
jgi:hypothetical protein